MANPRYDRLSFHLLAGQFPMLHESYVPGMSRFTPSPPEYDAAMHEGISPALRRGPLSFSHGMPPPNDGVMHDMITSGSVDAASSSGFFTQEEAKATEAIAAAARGGVDDQGFGDGAQDVVDEEEEEQANIDEEDDVPEPTSTSKGRKKRKKNSPPTEARIKWTGKEEECLAEAWKTVSMNDITDANQNFDTYWQRVKLAFNERKIVVPYFNKTVKVRGEKAMATHWEIMQAACSKWHGIQEEIADRPVSGADFECKVCLLAVSVDPRSSSFDSPASLCRCGGRSTCTTTTPTAKRSSTSTSSPASRPARSGRKYAGSSPRTRTSSTTPMLQLLPR
jgi:hypothetical protein